MTKYYYCMFESAFRVENEFETEHLSEVKQFCKSLADYTLTQKDIENLCEINKIEKFTKGNTRILILAKER